MAVELDPLLVSKLTIPPRPEVVVVLFEENRKEEPNLGRVVERISADVGLAGAMLRTVNSPAFGLGRKAQTVAQAVGLLGMRNVTSIATGLVLRYALGGGGNAALERFWDTAEKVALISAHLARALRGIVPEEAYTLGLFHDCGIPLLLRYFPSYKDTLILANQTAERGFFEVEDDAVGTNHGAVGYFVARSWELADDTCQAILRHHEASVFTDAAVSDRVRNLVGIIHVAQHVQHQSVRSTPDIEWNKFASAIMDHFGFDEAELHALLEDAQEACTAA